MKRRGRRTARPLRRTLRGQTPTRKSRNPPTPHPQATAAELPLFFMVSHLDDDGPVRLDGVKLGVCEVMGLELDEPKLGAFAGALNACDFPVQLLIRQHPPRLGRAAGQAHGGPTGQPAAADRGRVGVASQAVDRVGGPRRHPRPALLRHHRVRAVRRAARPAGAGPGCQSTPSAAGVCGC